MAVGEHIKTIITVAVSATIAASGVMYGAGKDVGANKVTADLSTKVAAVEKDAQAQEKRVTEFKADVEKKFDELKHTIAEEGQKTREAVRREGVKNAGGRQ